MRFEQIRHDLDCGAITSEQLTINTLKKIETTQSATNAFISWNEELALAQAKKADALLKKGVRLPLLGMPVAVKDLILCEAERATAGSLMLKDFVAPYDATVIHRLRAAGSVLVGKTNLDEFAMGSSSETSYFGPVKNPWDLTRVAGGSSGGSAAAVASDCVGLTLGTDTGGSIRQPAAFCGITGLKPTYGRVSRYGVIAFASSLDQVGPMASDVEGCAAVLGAISGRCEFDATSSFHDTPNYLLEIDRIKKSQGVRGLRVGVPQNFLNNPGLDSQVRSCIESTLKEFQNRGAIIVPIDLTRSEDALAVYYIICAAEASSNLARYDGIHFGYRSSERVEHLEDLYSRTRSEGFGSEVKRRILLGTFVLSSGYYDSYYKKASQVRRLIKDEFDQVFASCDVIASPCAPTTAFELGAKLNDPVAMYLSDIYTLSTNLAGLPGISFNVGLCSKGLPIGLQVLGPHFSETVLLGLGACWQSWFPQSTLPAPMFRGKS